MKIIADSSCLYTPQEAKEKNVEIIPVGVIINNQVYKDFIEIKPNELLTKLNEGVTPTTSQPNVGDVLETINSYDEDVLLMSIGDGLSGTYQSINMAKNMSDHPENVHVIDTKTLAGAYHYLVDKAVALKEKGLEIDKVIKELQESIEHSFSCVIPSDFQFLKRCGRLTPVAANLMGLIKIVPVLTLSEDRKKIEIFAVNRTVKKAMDSIIKHLNEMGVNEDYIVSICHVGALNKAQDVLNTIKNKISNATYEIRELSPSLMLHGGPGCILIHAVKK